MLPISVPVLFLGLLLSSSHPAWAQKPIYRCETAGKVSYAHEPCVGAKEIDATPTQGMDTMTGASRKGRDVQRHEQEGLMGTALQPLTGMSPDQYRVHVKRHKLSSQDKMDCTQLDAALPSLNQRAATTPAANKAMAEVELYKARKRFNDLNC